MTARPQVELPELPKARELLNYSGNVPFCYYSAAQMHAYARQAIAESEARAEGDARDAARYRVLRAFGKQMKLYTYDDPADACSGDWLYNPHPELVDELADTAIQAQEAEREAGSA